MNDSSIVIEDGIEYAECPFCRNLDVTKITDDRNPFWYSCGDCFKDFD